MSWNVARAEDSGEVAELLTLAFAEDPILAWVLPDGRNTTAARRRLFRHTLRLFMRDGLVEMTEGKEAAAVWGSPERARPSRATRASDMLRGFVAVLGAAGAAVGRSNRLYAAMREHHLRDAHWYLCAIGTHPEARGRGAASSLLEERLAVCDRDGLPAYLESSNASNLPLYERHGFEIIRQITVEDSPPLWLMVRSPQRRHWD